MSSSSVTAIENAVVSHLTKQLAHKDAKLEASSKLLAAKHAKIEDFSKQLTTKNEKIEELSCQLVAQAEKIKEYSVKLKVKDEEIQKYSHLFELQEKRNADCLDQIKDAKSQDFLVSELKKKNARIHKYLDELSAERGKNEVLKVRLQVSKLLRSFLLFSTHRN